MTEIDRPSLPILGLDTGQVNNNRNIFTAVNPDSVSEQDTKARKVVIG